MKKKRGFTWILVVVIILFVLIAGGFFLRRVNASANAAANSYQIEVASTGTITDVIGGTGNVSSKQSTTVVWQTSGVVKNVLVNQNDPVSSSQPLASLDPNSLSQSVLQAKSDLINLQSQLDDLYSNTSLNYAQAQLAVITDQTNLDDMVKAREQLNYARCDQNTIDEYQTEYQNQVDRVTNLEAINDGSTNIVNALRAARQARDTAYANYNYCVTPRSQSEIAEADAKVAQAQATLALDQSKLDAISPSNPDPNQVAALQAKITADQTIINAADLKAPFAGNVTEINIQPGDQVSAGTPAFRIDDLSQMLVDVQISEVDINRVQLGQNATLTFDAINGKEYQAVVSKIASVGTSSQNVVDFTVTLTITNPDADIKPGMTAVVNIIAQQYENVLLIPNQAIRVVDGNRVVYIQETSGILTPVTVDLGISSDSYSQVLGGELKAGNRIVLNPPDISTTPQNPGFGQRLFGGG
jgi:HlyD family secretion protein